MSLGKTLTHTTWILSASVLIRILGAVVQIILARLMGSSVYGSLATAQAIHNIAIMLTEWGFNAVHLRRAAGSDDKGHVGYLVTSIAYKFVSSLLVLLGLYMFVSVTGYPREIQSTVMILGASMPLAAVVSSVLVFYQAKQQMRAVSYVQLLQAVLTTSSVLAVVFAFNRVEPAWVAGATFIGHMLTTLVVVKPIIRQVDWTFGWKGLRYPLRETLPFALSSIFFTVYFNLDTVMLSKMSSPSEVGTYSAAYRLASVFFLFTTALSTTFLPHMYRISQTDDGPLTSLGKYSSTATKYLLAIGAPISLGLILVSRDVIELIYGPAFLSAAVCLKVLAPFVLLRFVGVAAADSITVLRREWLRTRVQGGAAILNLSMNFVLIPRYHALGAATATVISDAFLCGAYLYLARKLLGTSFVVAIGDVGRVAVSLVVLAVTVWAVGRAGLPATVLAGAMSYTLSMILLGFVPKKDLAVVLRRIFPNL